MASEDEDAEVRHIRGFEAVGGRCREAEVEWCLGVRTEVWQQSSVGGM